MQVGWVGGWSDKMSGCEDAVEWVGGQFVS